MKKTFGFLLLFVLAILGICYYAFIQNKQIEKVEKVEKINSDIREFKIEIIQIVEIEPIAELIKGFKSAIKESDLSKSVDIQFGKIKDAQNDKVLLNQIVDQIIAEKPDLIYTLGTSVSQAIIERTNSIPIVQGGVTDPVKAGLARSWEGSGRNYAASTDLPPVKQQFLLFKEIFPNKNRIGVVYDSGELNSVALIERTEQIAKELMITIVQKPITTGAEISTAVTSLVGKVDAIYIPTDNTVHNALETLIQVANDGSLPTFNCTESAVLKGSLFAIGGSYYDIGYSAGKIAVRILSGEDPSNIPISFIENPKLFWNDKVAKFFNIDLTEDLKRRIKSQQKENNDKVY